MFGSITTPSSGSQMWCLGIGPGGFFGRFFFSGASARFFSSALAFLCAVIMCAKMPLGAARDRELDVPSVVVVVAAVVVVVVVVVAVVAESGDLASGDGARAPALVLHVGGRLVLLLDHPCLALQEPEWRVMTQK